MAHLGKSGKPKRSLPKQFWGHRQVFLRGDDAVVAKIR
jgi:hypothetical protein